MAATYLLRACLAMTDMAYGNYSLHYVRTTDKKEIDFIVARDNYPVFALEVKSSESSLPKPLRDRHKWLFENPTLGVQVVDQRGMLQKHEDDTWVVSIERFLHLLS